MFTVCFISKGKTIAAHYVSLVYTDLSKQPMSINAYSEDSMVVSINIFSRRAIEPPNLATDPLDAEDSCWIVATPFCSMGYIIGAKYLI